ncbi:MAG TPA: SDR family NAD(P)-dependent oxidoreductase [Luteibaculaceae bacterium]|nr:SDR family NAD(P)-dependent oxidoreductase [Luteibaculaceae bacterium]
MKTIAITGATSGIGRATAVKFAQMGHRLIITGRRADRLQEAAQILLEAGAADVLPLVFDVQDLNSVNKALTSIPEKWRSFDVLINNAGLAAGRSTIDEGDLNDWEQMINTNVKGLLYVTRWFIPFFKAQKQGTIINLGSIAGKEAYQGGNVYCATKYAVDALTKTMRIDLLPYGIRVGSICPGAVETEFSLVRFKGDAEKAEAVYQGYEPLQAEDIAEAIVFMATRPAHVTINDMVIMPTAQANTTHLHKN